MSKRTEIMEHRATEMVRVFRSMRSKIPEGCELVGILFERDGEYGEREIVTVEMGENPESMFNPGRCQQFSAVLRDLADRVEDGEGEIV